jgi:hypothetical protein
MSIEDFFNNINERECPELNINVCESKSIEDFFNMSIKATLPEIEIVKQWHELLKKYISDPEAVLFIRRYASNKDKNGNWDIRRGFLTIFNNIKIVYVDNYFAQYFYAMAYNKFVPEYNDFKQFIQNRKIPCGYRDTEKEREHQAYKKGPIYPLNDNGWKLSHVFSANQNDYTFNYKEIASEIFPKGEYINFTKINGESYPYRKIDENVLEENLIKIKAHFMRVVHPINHFLTPMRKFQNSTIGIKDIGEHPEMLKYIKYKLNEDYGSIFTEYLKIIMANDSILLPKNHNIDLSYGKNLIKSCSINTEHKTIKPTTKSTSSIDRINSSPTSCKTNSFTDEQIANSIKAYIFDGLSFRVIERECLKISKEVKVRGGGFVAKKLLNGKGIDKSMKKLFYNKSISEAISLANESLKPILAWLEAINQKV